MGSRYEVEVTVTSAKDLKNVNWRHGSLKPYAVVWVDPSKKFSTRVDEDGDTCPFWSDKLVVPFDSPVEDSTLHVDIVHAAAADDTKPLVGSTKLPLRAVVDDVGLGGRVERRLELKRPSGRPQGKVEVEVVVREGPRYGETDPYYAAQPYGVPPPGTRDYPAYAAAPPYAPPAYAAPPAGYPAYGYGGGQPSYGHAGYGQQGGYYGQQVGSYGQQGGYYGQQGDVEGQKSKFGGMGAGLAVGAVAGALGGLALAEGVDVLEDKIADDVADRVEDDLGYDGDDF